ncbi:patatin family protein [Amycolatopsis sp. NPDC051903]|uniref:patatin family protein n=1 Tax=Amycolatopsis sp. NPDC051903 TaxID=3363936 RepID=UPI0037A4F896
MTEAVRQVLRARARQGSTPGNRSDDARVALVIEGGSSRGAYSSGMTIAIEQLGLLPAFDAVYGSSAGALSAAWLLCGRAESTQHAWWDQLIMGTTINPRRVLRRQPVVDTGFLVNTVYTEILPMGFREILDNPVEFHPLATDALTGESVDLRGHARDQAGIQAALRASTAMPLLAGEPIMVGGRAYVDAGVSESVPIRTALAQHATHVVALRTRRGDEPAATPPSGGERLVAGRWFARHAPGAMDPWLRRDVLKAEEEHLLATHPATLQIRPPVGSPNIGRTERRPRLMRAAVDTGRQAAWNELAPCVKDPG